LTKEIGGGQEFRVVEDHFSHFVSTQREFEMGVDRADEEKRSNDKRIVFEAGDAVIAFTHEV
jgi:hypothetical protein